MKKKHYDNKNDLIRRMREVEVVQNRADHAVAASWSAFMMLGLLTLYEDCGLYNELFIPDLLYTTFPYEYTYNILMREFCEASELS